MRLAAVAAAILVGLLASLGWRRLGFAFDAVWRDFLYETVLEASLGRHADGEAIFGFIALWAVPVAVSWVICWLVQRNRGPTIHKPRS